MRILARLHLQFPGTVATINERDLPRSFLSLWHASAMTFGALAGGLLRADSDYPDATRIRRFNKSAPYRAVYAINLIPILSAFALIHYE